MKYDHSAAKAAGFYSVLFAYAIAIIGIIGWVKCVIKLSDQDFKAPYKSEVIYAVGVFIPFTGAVIGYLDITDE